MAEVASVASAGMASAGSAGAGLAEATATPDAGVPVTGKVLEWAREESGWELAEVAEKLGVDESAILDWEKGRSQPSKGQVTKLAETYKRAKAVFFLPEAPPPLLQPSFRKAPGSTDRKLTPTELVKIRSARRLQQYVSWMLEESEAGIATRQVILDGHTEKNAEEVAADLRGKLGISIEEQIGWKNASEAFRGWRWAVEGLGILVLQKSMGERGSNEKGIRGFSFQDDYAPMAVVNTAYNHEARIFTLFHELGHIFNRSDAACVRFSPKNSDSTERLCDQFSAAVLMPREDFLEQAEQIGVYTESPSTNAADAKKLARKFKVSMSAASIRLRQLGLAEQTYFSLVEKNYPNSDLDKGWGRPGKSNGNQRKIKATINELGDRAIQIVFEAYERKDINIADLTDYLDITTGMIDSLRDQIRSR